MGAMSNSDAGSWFHLSDVRPELAAERTAEGAEGHFSVEQRIMLDRRNATPTVILSFSLQSASGIESSFTDCAQILRCRTLGRQKKRDDL